MKRNRFKQDNRGASLLAVLVLMVVVSLIAVVITKITIVNIEMKEVERGTKKNFYSADELMDNLRAGANEVVYPEKQIAEWAAIRYTADLNIISTSSSVSGRGMSTPGVTRKVLPKKRASPKIYCIGSKLCKRARMLSNSCSSFTDKIISLPR